MSENVEGVEEAEKKIALLVEELPELPKDYVRLVHITRPEQKDSLLEKGLNYQKYGMAMSTARVWSKADEVQMWSDDPRFNFLDAKALIMDIPAKEWSIHNNLTRSDIAKAPGVILPKYIVGFVDSKPSTTT